MRQEKVWRKGGEIFGMVERKWSCLVERDWLQNKNKKQKYLMVGGVLKSEVVNGV